MSLDNVQLPPIVLQDLFKNSLISQEPDNAASKPSFPTPGLSFLGDNQKKIAIIVSDTAAIYLPDEDLNFLLGILKACNLNMADIALLNLAANPSLNHLLINQELAAEKILLFGVEPLALELPLQFPHYQVQQYNNQAYLSSPALNILQNDKEEKLKLWACLKKLFLPG
jgi:hypothetical protein